MSDSEPSPEPQQIRRVGFFTRLARSIIKAGGGDVAELAEAMNEREDRGEKFALSQKDMILKAARFDRLRVIDVMRPRAEIVAVEASSTLGEAARIFLKANTRACRCFARRWMIRWGLCMCAM